MTEDGKWAFGDGDFPEMGSGLEEVGSGLEEAGSGWAAPRPSLELS